VTLVNTYYFGRLMEKTPPAAGDFLAQPDLKNKAAGVHVNVSAPASRSTPRTGRRAKADRRLSSDKAQNLFADVNLEYPVNPKVAPDKTVAAWAASSRT